VSCISHWLHGSAGRVLTMTVC